MINNNKRKICYKAFLCVIAVIFVFTFVSKSIELKNINEITVYGNDNIDTYVNAAVSSEHIVADVKEDIAVLKLFGVIPLKTVDINRVDTDSICLGGQAFGIKMFTKGVIVVGITDINTHSGVSCPAEKAGINKGDIIVSVNGREILSAEDFGKKISEQKGNNVTIRFIRGEEELETVLTPVVSTKDNSYKVGLWVRDSTAGIGTITFIDKKSGMFGGLGHGVCDVDTGLLMPFERGKVVNVNINGVVKGEADNPGELKGTFEKESIGELNSNTNVGVFGQLENVDNLQCESVKIGDKESVSEGKVYIYTTISGSQPKKYEAEIVKILDKTGETKNFMIKITDKELLSKTGGIVQGMSGSPIIQNGKLIGAVTHVLVKNPEKGYGIFIENMLKATA